MITRVSCGIIKVGDHAGTLQDSVGLDETQLILFIQVQILVMIRIVLVEKKYKEADDSCW